jgi:WD40 repeat protein
MLSFFNQANLEKTTEISPAFPDSSHDEELTDCLPLLKRDYTKNPKKKLVEFRRSSSDHFGRSASTFLLDGNVVSASRDKGILHIWDTQTGHCLKELKGYGDEVTCLAALANGNIARGSLDGTLRILDPKTSECQNELKGHTDGISCVIDLPNGHIVSGSWDQRLCVWDLEKGICLKILGDTRYKPRGCGVDSITFLSDEILVSGSGDGIISIWNLQTGECQKELRGHRKGVHCIVLLSNGNIVSSGEDNTLRVWDPKTGECLRVLPTPTMVAHMAALPNDNIVGGSSNIIYIFNPQTGAFLSKHTFTHFDDWMHCLTVLPDGNIANLHGGSYQEWDFPVKQHDLQMNNNLEGVTAYPKNSWHNVFSFLDNKENLYKIGEVNHFFYTLSRDKGSFFNSVPWPKRDYRQKPKKEWIPHPEGLTPIMYTCFAILPNSNIIAGATDGRLRIWDSKTGECQKELKGHSNGIRCVVFLSNGNFVSGSSDGTLRIWDSKTGECQKELKGHSNGINCIVPLSNGNFVSGSSDETLCIWDSKTGVCLRELIGHSKGISDIAILPNNDIVSSSSDGTLRIWDPKTGECRKKLIDNTTTGSITCVTTSPNGNIVSGFIGKLGNSLGGARLYVWDSKTGACLKKLEKGNESSIIHSIDSVSALSDNNVVSYQNGIFYIWDLKTETCLHFSTHIGELPGWKEKQMNILSDGNIMFFSSSNYLGQSFFYKLCFPPAKVNHNNLEEQDLERRERTRQKSRRLW